MARRVRPAFLAPASYRQKRLRDASRLLPLLGLALLLVPLLWVGSGEPGGVANSAALRYVFAVWGILVACALLLLCLIRPADEPDGSAGSDEGA